MKRSQTLPSQIVGLIPAAGYSRRIAPLPCSKEVYPIGFYPTASGVRPKPVCQYLIESMKAAGIGTIYMVVRKGKLDIPGYLGDGRHMGVDIAYRVMDDSAGPPYALDHAYPFVKDATVAFGFPDIVVHAPHAFTRLLTRYQEGNVDVVLGIFRIEKAIKDDRVVLDRAGRVKQFAVSTSGARDPHTWCLAVWGPRFTEYLHEFVGRVKRGKSAHADAELTVGHVLAPAFDDGLRMCGIMFAKGTYLDIGTPASLKQAVWRYCIKS